MARCWISSLAQGQLRRVRSRSASAPLRLSQAVAMVVRGTLVWLSISASHRHAANVFAVLLGQLASVETLSVDEKPLLRIVAKVMLGGDLNRLRMRLHGRTHAIIREPDFFNLGHLVISSVNRWRRC